MNAVQRSYRALAAFAALAPFASSPAWGGPHDHRDGFFLRLSGGFAFAQSSIDNVPGTVDKIEVDGNGGEANIAIGGIVTRNFALHGTLFGVSMSDPDVKLENSPDPGSADFDVTAIGGGVTYYFMPINLYISGSLGVGTLNLDTQNPDFKFDSDTGLAADFTIGKEWWVSRDWGLGLAGGFQFHDLPGENTTNNWQGSSVAIRFSATYN